MMIIANDNCVNKIIYHPSGFLRSEVASVQYSFGNTKVYIVKYCQAEANFFFFVFFLKTLHRKSIRSSEKILCLFCNL